MQRPCGQIMLHMAAGGQGSRKAPVERGEWRGGPRPAPPGRHPKRVSEEKQHRPGDQKFPNHLSGHPHGGHRREDGASAPKTVVHVL